MTYYYRNEDTNSFLIKMRSGLIFTLLALAAYLAWSGMQTKNQGYLEYIKAYHELAVTHEILYRIPADITLAQGLLESGAGKSALAVESNNHFGIKCHSEWKGKRVYHNDDRPGECFRKYRKVEDSYDDHSRFLSEHSRYARLFRLDIRDYRAWAKGLSQCGYATDPGYANKLIKIIEDYELYKYGAQKSKHKSGKQPNLRLNIAVKQREIFRTNGLLYVVAGNGDDFNAIAADLGFKVKDLIKYNEVDKDFPLYKGDIVYLEKKK
ncbi:MAG: glucosaminidase domain-containing protein, partial [Dysgonamonadaceae bacterium]|nr:glucosaminidase domain-containing protein [Dysgonamonadaceae bacterium]